MSLVSCRLLSVGLLAYLPVGLLACGSSVRKFECSHDRMFKRSNRMFECPNVFKVECSSIRSRTNAKSNTLDARWSAEQKRSEQMKTHARMSRMFDKDTVYQISSFRTRLFECLILECQKKTTKACSNVCEETETIECSKVRTRHERKVPHALRNMVGGRFF